MSSFDEKVKNIRGGPLVAKEVSILQVNLGYACNMSCKHCHLSAGPDRNEMMNLETIVTCPVTVDHWEGQLKSLIERHLSETGSRRAAATARSADRAAPGASRPE